MVSSAHILLVNSIDADRAELRQLLEPLQFKVTEVSSGLEAVDALQQARFDLVVTAIAIGEFDCWRLARFIRSGICHGGKKLPIVVVARAWCERITEITARDFEINQLLNYEDRNRLPELVCACLEESQLGLAKRRVLVIEDHSDNAQLIEKVLSPRYEVELAADGVTGLDAWKERKHDLVLLDVMLPQMSGGEVLRRIVAIDPRQPVVMVTAHGTMDVAKKLMLSGAADFVTKPFRVEELRRVCELAARREDYLVSNRQVGQRMDSLRQLQNLLANIINSMPSLLIGVDILGKINLWNQHAEDICGIAEVAAKGQSLVDVWPDFQALSEIELALQQGEIRKLQKVTQQLHGEECYCDITIYPLRESIVIGAVIRIDDVTERVRLEERIIQSEKMASMGQLATGMAHEINNPLAGVMQNIQVINNRLSINLKANRDAAEAAGLNMNALEEYVQRRDIGSCLDAVMDAGKRTAKLIDNMVSFSHCDNDSIVASSLSDLLDKSVELATGNFSLKRKFDFRLIEIKRDYDSSLPLVACNPMQIQQVFFNLILNGANAMEEKLRNIRKAGGEGSYLPRFILRTKYSNKRARVEIEDNGVGMDKEMCQRLFEPFHSHVSVEENTGLGLSLCYYIVTENHRGGMEVESRRNVGSRFVLELPLK
mgnify:CR=1 FL=1